MTFWFEGIKKYAQNNSNVNIELVFETRFLEEDEWLNGWTTKQLHMPDEAHVSKPCAFN